MTMVKNLMKQFIQVLSMGHFVYKFPSGRKIYLTFDDGPDGRYTGEILDLLYRFSAKSTFFLVGKNVGQHPEIVAEIKARGHAIGLHTYSHKRLDIMTKNDFKQEVAQNQEAIEEIIGEKPFILRPPEAKMRFKNLMWAIRDGLKIIHFTIASNDWKANSGCDIVKAIRISQTRGGEIISFHDNNRHTVEALPVLLESLLGAGYCCAPIVFDEEV